MSTHATREHDLPATTPLPLGALTDGCASCGAPLATDQRYCLQCGARRGRARFTAAPAAAAAGPAAVTTVEHVQTPPPAPRMSGSTTLVAGIGTLLLALGVGVLIGQGSGDKGGQRAAMPQVITVGAAGAPASSATPTAPTTAAAAKGSGKKAKVKTTVVKVDAKTAKNAAQAATKVLGKAAPKQPTVQPGEKCQSSQAGCAGGKFTGDFFGP